jgi:hypothetical protein
MPGVTSAPPFEYPAFYQAASAAAASGQRIYMRSIRIRLIALVVSAVGGALTWKVGDFEPLAWLALVGFVVALGAEVVILALHPDQKWYEGRAAAESAKTLTWRYAVAGDPFRLGEPRAAANFRAQLANVTRDLTVIPAPDPAGGEEITATMREARAEDYAARRAAYVAGRIEDQRSWYAGKARRAERLNTTFLLITIVLEFVGITAAAVRVAGFIDFDLLGILAAVTGGFAAWAQTRQWGSLARAYAIAANELATIKGQATEVLEDAWPRFVDEAEEAISREHTLWRSSRGVLGRSMAGSAPPEPEAAPG